MRGPIYRAPVSPAVSLTDVQDDELKAGSGVHSWKVRNGGARENVRGERVARVCFCSAVSGPWPVHFERDSGLSRLRRPCKARLKCSASGEERRGEERTSRDVKGRLTTIKAFLKAARDNRMEEEPPNVVRGTVMACRRDASQSGVAIAIKIGDAVRANKSAGR